MIKNYVDIDTKLDKVNDECGVFGIYRNDDDIDVVAAANDALSAFSTGDSRAQVSP